MSQYIVSARKYRPDNFETLIGQDNIARTLKNSILRGQLAHAYLFCGPRGVGKTTTARIFAKMINCSNPKEDMEPCGECESCKSFAEGRSYCIHELDAASNNGIEDIKALIDQVRVPPQVGKYSVYIIDEVHMLSTAAFNAFLKTLEEPPAHAIFILATTEKHKILPTILSRCQTYDFNRISVSDIVGNLRDIATKENITIGDESLHVIAQKADGAMRDALTIFDQTVAFCGTDIKYEDVLKNLNVLSQDHCFALVDDFLKGDYPAALLKFDEILGKGFNALHFVAALSSHFRDLVVSKSAGLDALLDLPDSMKARYKEQADRCNIKFLYDALGITAQCESGYKASINPRLHIEFALMKLSFIANAPVSQPAVQQPVAAQAPAPARPVQAPSPSVTPARPAPAQPAAPVQTAPAAPQSAAAPAKPQSPAQPEAPAPRRRKMAPALSVTSILAEDEKVEKKAEVKQAEKEPDQDTLTAKWGEVAALYASKPRLANAICSAKLNFGKDADTIVINFLVANDAVASWIRTNALAGLEGKVRELAGWSKIRLEVGVQERLDEQKEAFTPDEKFAAMAQNNPEVKNFISELGGVLK